MKIIGHLLISVCVFFSNYVFASGTWSNMTPVAKSAFSSRIKTQYANSILKVIGMNQYDKATLSMVEGMLADIDDNDMSRIHDKYNSIENIGYDYGLPGAASMSVKGVTEAFDVSYRLNSGINAVIEKSDDIEKVLEGSLKSATTNNFTMAISATNEMRKFYESMGQLFKNEDVKRYILQEAIIADVLSENYTAPNFQKAYRATERFDINGKSCTVAKGCSSVLSGNPFSFPEVDKIIEIKKNIDSAKKMLVAAEKAEGNINAFVNIYIKDKASTEAKVDAVIDTAITGKELYDNTKKIGKGIKATSKLMNVNLSDTIPDWNTYTDDEKNSMSLFWSEGEGATIASMYYGNSQAGKTELLRQLNILIKKQYDGKMQHALTTSAAGFLNGRESKIKNIINSFVSENDYSAAKKFAESYPYIVPYAENKVNEREMVDYFSKQKKIENYLLKPKLKIEQGKVEDDKIFLSGMTGINNNAVEDANYAVKVNIIEAEVKKQTEASVNAPLDAHVSLIGTQSSGGWGSAYEGGKTVDSFTIHAGDKINNLLKSKVNINISKINSPITNVGFNSSGYDYTAWGEWNGNGRIYTDQSGHMFNIDHGHYTVGLATDRYPGGKMPSTGTATYNGTLHGDYISTTGDIERNAIGGTISLNANFSNNTIGGTLNATKGGSSWATASTGSMSIHGDSYYNNNLNINGGGTGGLEGSFNGPNAEETSGGFWLSTSSGTPGNAAGVYTAKQ